MNYKELKGFDLLRELCLTFGPSGCEDLVAEKILAVTKGCYDEQIKDNISSVILKISARAPFTEKDGVNPKKLMLSCHMDEVGFIVSDITDEGYLKVIFLSGNDTRVWKGRNVLVGNEKGTIKGYFGSVPIHLIKKEDRSKATPVKDLYIDIGAESKEEAEKYVSIGDFGTYDSDFVVFGQNDRMIKAKAIDDRLGCTVMCDLVREVWEIREALPFDVYFAFTCKEELGLSGARCAAYTVEPDYALIFEATAVADVEGTPEASKVAKQGDGGAVSLMDKGTIYDRDFADFIMSVSKKNNIPCQYKRYVSGGNDAAAIHKSREGVRCAALSVPARYIHTASNVIRRSDFEAIHDTALACIKELCL